MERLSLNNNMRSAFIFHGSNGSNNAHWYPWLKKKLEERNLQVFLPQFPIGDEQTLENWLNTLNPFKNNLNNSILIGHSLGVPFILNILDLWDYKIKATFFVSGFIGNLEVEDDPNIKYFSEKNFDWNKIKKNCKRFYVFHSDNDPYVPLEKAEEIVDKLGVKVILIKGGKHFQEQSGFKTFDLLLKKIDNEIKIE